MAQELVCDLNNVLTNLKSGLVNSDDVDLSNYLAAYGELYNFFMILGKVFGFVASDVKDKMKILKDLQDEEVNKTEKLHNFKSVKSMIEYEKEANLLTSKNYVSGSRTLLRLHRGIDFIQVFLKKVYEAENSLKLGSVCKESYDKTLANFHNWVIRKSASAAMHFLPTREDLLKKIANGNPERVESMVSILPEMLEVMSETYTRVDGLYTIHSLHTLP